MYSYIGLKRTFRTAEGRLYAIDVLSPVTYRKMAEAIRDNTGYRFESIDSAVKLVIYRGEWAVVDNYSNGSKALIPVVVGDKLAEYSTTEFLSIPGNRLLRYVSPEERIADGLSVDEFVPICESFDQLFPDLKSGMSIYIGKSGSYRIRES